MSSLLAERPVGPARLRGVQSPRILVCPDGDDVQGRDACDWLERVGLVLDPWQRLVMEKALRERVDGQWSAFEVGLLVSRQNGKGSVLAARALAGLFLFGEELIIHTAHQWKTAHEAFLRIRQLIQASPDLMSRVKGFPCSPGSDAVLLKDGRRLQFIARSKSSGRGFSADLVILDEAYDLTADQMAALLPTLSAMPNPQIWYTSSAPMAHSEVLHRLRRRAIEGDTGRLCMLEWSAPEDCDPDSREAWAQSNPAKEIRIFEDFIEAERAALPLPEFGRERLGWPDRPSGNSIFPLGVWEACEDPESDVSGVPMFGLAVAEDRSWSSIGAAGPAPVGTHVDSGDYKPGTAWVVRRCVELLTKWPSASFVLRPGGAAGSLLADLEKAGVPVVKCSTQQYAQACGAFHDAVVGGELRHAGQAELNVSVGGALKRPSGDGFCWDQRRSSLDISPLEAVTLAFWGHLQGPGPSVYEDRGVVFL